MFSRRSLFLLMTAQGEAGGGSTGSPPFPGRGGKRGACARVRACISQRRHFRCSSGKHTYFTRTAIVLAKTKYVIFLK